MLLLNSRYYAGNGFVNYFCCRSPHFFRALFNINNLSSLPEFHIYPLLSR
jgi:hypothetical protein